MYRSIILILAVFFWSFLPAKFTAIPHAVQTVIIDPGHGGMDPGAKGSYSHEADIALAVSLQLGKAMKEAFPGIKVVYTRTRDELAGGFNNVGQSLKYRASMANEARGDVFISIHCNSMPARVIKHLKGYKTSYRYTGNGRKRKRTKVSTPVYQITRVPNTTKGTETYIWAADRSEDKAKYIHAGESGENMSDTSNLPDLNSPEARIQGQLYTKYYFRNSYTLAQAVEASFAKAGRNSFGVKQRNNKGIWVLQATGMPSILIELGFLTNKDEEDYLNSASGQQEMVDNIMEGFRSYKSGLER